MKYEIVEAGHETPCWMWTGQLNDRGYGLATTSLHRLAHRAVWLDTYGPLKEGLELDHLCRNRACVNPDHLEPVTHQENVRRGWWARHTHGKSSLKDARVAARMSQGDLAEQIGCGQTSVTHWETGQHQPAPDVRRAIAELLGDESVADFPESLSKQERIAEAHRLRALGWTLRRIGDEIGVSNGCVCRWLTDYSPDGQKVYEDHERRQAA